LPCKNPPLGSESVPALSSCRMWTVCMINCLRYASYHADTGPLEPLMCRSQVRDPWGEWVNCSTDFNLKPPDPSKFAINVMKTTGSTQIVLSSHRPAALSYISISNHVMYERAKINKKSGSMPPNLYIFVGLVEAL
jgi:hypothetical protein